MNNYQQTIAFIKQTFNKRQQKMLVRYLNGELFEQDLIKLINTQELLGEPLAKNLAIECTLLSYINEEETYAIQ